MTAADRTFRPRRPRRPWVPAARWLCVAIPALALLPSAQAQPRSSASYTISADTLDAGGGQTTGVSYAESASLGTIAGTSDSGAPAHLLKAGLFARFFDPTGIQLVTGAGGALASAGLPEGGTLQLAAYQELDDGTFQALAATSVAWSVAGERVVSVSPGGLATAGIVYKDSAAEISGAFGGFTDTLSVTVLNVNPDDFGTYAGDGLADNWQVQYFGLDNPLAHPAADASGTGQTNLFKYTAGLDPTDPASRFTLEIQPVDGQPAQKDLILTPVFGDRTYQVEYTTDLLTGVWLPLPGGVENTVGQVRTVTDPAATQAAKHYRVRITKP